MNECNCKFCFGKAESKCITGFYVLDCPDCGFVAIDERVLMKYLQPGQLDEEALKMIGEFVRDQPETDDGKAFELNEDGVLSVLLKHHKAAGEPGAVKPPGSPKSAVIECQTCFVPIRRIDGSSGPVFATCKKCNRAMKAWWDASNNLIVEEDKTT